MSVQGLLLTFKNFEKYQAKDPVLTKANEWEEKTIEMKSLSAYLMYLPLFYTKEYFQSDAHQNILKKMGFVK